MAESNGSSAVGPRRVAIERVAWPGREEFETRYLAAGVPIVLTGAVAKWPALETWSAAYFKANYGEHSVKASVDLPEDEVPYNRYEDDHVKTMRVGEFVDWLGAKERRLPCYVDQFPIRMIPGAERDYDFSHMTPQRERDAVNGGLLPGAAVERTSESIWLGSEGTRSGLHYDSRDNFLVQVVGRKRASLVRPDQFREVYPFTWNITKSQVNPEEPDLARFPRLADATVYEATIGPGDALFIPALWWHFLRSLETSISVNQWYGTPKTNRRQYYLRMGACGPAYVAEFVRQFAVNGVMGRKYRCHLFCSRYVGELEYQGMVDGIKARVRGIKGRVGAR